MKKKFKNFLLLMTLACLFACTASTEEDIAEINNALQKFTQESSFQHSAALKDLIRFLRDEGLSQKGLNVYQRAKALRDRNEGLVLYLDSLQKLDSPSSFLSEAEGVYQAHIRWLNQENKDLDILYPENLTLAASAEENVQLGTKNKALSIHYLKLLQEQVLEYEKAITEILGPHYLLILNDCGFGGLDKVQAASRLIPLGEYYEAEIYLGRFSTVQEAFIRSITVNEEPVFHEDSLYTSTRWRSIASKAGWHTWQATIKASIYGQDTLLYLEGKYLTQKAK